MKVKDTDMKNIWKLNLKNKLKKEECAGKPVFPECILFFWFYCNFGAGVSESVSFDTLDATQLKGRAVFPAVNCQLRAVCKCILTDIHEPVRQVDILKVCAACKCSVTDMTNIWTKGNPFNKPVVFKAF